MSQRVGTRRFVIEGADIVSSILLAFAIQAWWDDREAAELESRLLAAVLDEVRGNQALVDRDLAFHAGMRDNIYAILDLGSAATPDIRLLAADSILAMTTWYALGGYESGALEALTSGGQLSSVREERVRRLIARLPLVYAQAERTTRQDQEFYAGVLMPYLRETAFLPQVSNALGPRPGSDTIYGVEDVGEEADRVDHRAVVLDMAFQNIMLQKLWLQIDMRNEVEDLGEVLNEVEEGLAAALGDAPPSPGPMMGDTFPRDE
jgi:hypothetical protein